MEVASLLRDTRIRAGLSQRELAERAGTSQPAIARYESGAVEPSLSTLSRLITACGYQLRLETDAIAEDDLRRLRAAMDQPPAARVEANRRATRLAAQAAEARRLGRVKRLADA